MNIYVGNLSFNVSEDDLRQVFAQYGKVTSVVIIKDRDTGRSKGFAFVEMPNIEEVNSAITALNGQTLLGRGLIVNEARPREESSRRYRDGERFYREGTSRSGRLPGSPTTPPPPPKKK